MAIVSVRKNHQGAVPAICRNAFWVLAVGVALGATQARATGTAPGKVVTPASNPARQTLLSSQSAKAWDKHYARVNGRANSAAQRRAKINNRKTRAQQRSKARAAKR